MAEAHPFAIHLPLVLIFLWPLIDGLGLLLHQPILSRLGFGLLCLAAVGSLVATATGQAAFDAALARHSAELLNTHAELANVMPWSLLALAALRGFGAAKWGKTGHLLALGCSLGTWYLVFVVGQSGGRLVYEHGVGVRMVQPTKGR